MKIYVATKYENENPEVEEWDDVYVGTNLETALDRLNSVCVVDDDDIYPEELKQLFIESGLDYPGKCFCGTPHMYGTINLWEDGSWVSCTRLWSNEEGVFKIE